MTTPTEDAKALLERADAWPRPAFPTEASEFVDALSTALERLLSQTPAGVSIAGPTTTATIPAGHLSGGRLTPTEDALARIAVAESALKWNDAGQRPDIAERLRDMIDLASSLARRQVSHPEPEGVDAGIRAWADRYMAERGIEPTPEGQSLADRVARGEA